MESDFLGIEITKVGDGFALSQESYIREIIRVHEIPTTQRDLITTRRRSTLVVPEDETGHSIYR